MSDRTNLLSLIYKKMLKEQARKTRPTKVTKRKTKSITVWRYNLEKAEEEWVTIKVPDSGTFKEMWEKYGNQYQYWCAQISDWQLFVDPTESKKHDGKKHIRHDRRKTWDGVNKILDYILEVEYGDSQIHPLEYYADHTAWIDSERGVILVEKAGL